MEQGSLRVDANISIPVPADNLGTKAEVKNLNSFATWSAPSSGACAADRTLESGAR